MPLCASIVFRKPFYKIMKEIESQYRLNSKLEDLKEAELAKLNNLSQ